MWNAFYKSPFCPAVSWIFTFWKLLKRIETENLHFKDQERKVCSSLSKPSRRLRFLMHSFEKNIGITALEM